ncbi:Os12g0495001 [Oryza sativa Japonica Group]|uniref:Os12g0495001 protein n=1 Tax=Oryza sativa subsp. japonica TaxID=39947 RepID=A0A0P0YAA3_ORYSJ|nr:Os12g0495001 [Oryza sativa Japonica Group]
MGRWLVELRRAADERESHDGATAYGVAAAGGGTWESGVRAHGSKQDAGGRKQAGRRPASGRRGNAAVAAARRGAWAMGKGRHRGNS